MAQQTIKVKNGVMKLPKSWKGAKVFARVSKNTITLTRMSEPSLSLSDMMDAFQQAARRTKLKKEDIEKAITEVRKGRL